MTSLHPILLGLAAPAAMGLIFGAIVLADRLLEPYRDIRRPITVVDRRTYKLALARIAKLEAEDDLVRVKFGLTAVRVWLRGEIHTGPKRRRLAHAAALEQTELRLEQVNTILFGQPTDMEAF